MAVDEPADAEPREIHEGPAHYGSGTECSQQMADIVAVAMWDVGAPDAAVERMLGVVSRESGCDSAAYNGNTATGDDSFGLCQINRRSGWFSRGQLLSGVDPLRFAGDPTYNAEACATLYERCGFGPWRYGNYGCARP